VYARSTTFTARLESIDAGIAYIRDEVMPELQTMEGCIGLSMMADRQSGRCIATSAWQSEDAMRATEGRVHPMRERATQIAGGTPQVEEWEIAVLHRDHRTADGACVRATWTRSDPARIDSAIESYKTSVLPAMERLDGFCSASLLVNRTTGLAVSSAVYDSVAAMEGTREAANELRESGARDAGVEITDVCEFELVLAHLRVPELV
jgi:quinol monooxygenase YgiN